jgi:hypothetical protein
MERVLLPGLPIDLILEAYASAPGNEIKSGKFESPESSAALAANTFGLFLNQASKLPPLQAWKEWDWPASSVRLEKLARFPWAGGLHPCLDVLIGTPKTLIGVEAKRYEPFRTRVEAKPNKTEWSDAYWRPVWGDAMQSYERVRDALHGKTLKFSCLNATQLVKHAFGLRTAVHRKGEMFGKRPVLVYLFAEPNRWPNGRPISANDISLHREEIAHFATLVTDDEVTFHSSTYRELIEAWRVNIDDEIRVLAETLLARFVF